ncbi:MAG: hypothetical protein WCV59_05365 [Parcubacteria group bacterium]|jgi:hypothetical protein
MEKIRRKIFFWTLVIIFFIVAPAIILNARGYRFDSTRGVFVYSGTVTIKSNPQTVDLSLNGQPASGQVSRINSSNNLSGLLPGNYEIVASLPGYRPWTKETDVHSGVASEFWNVMLVRENYTVTNYDTAAGIDKFFISPKNKFIAYSKNSDGLKIGILNIASKITESEFPIDGWNLMADAKKENIEWSPNEDYISVPVEKEIAEKETVKKKTSIATTSPTKTQYAYFVINPAEKNIFNLNEFLGKDSIQDARWDPKNKDYLFFLEGQSLWRANITNKDDLTLISDNVAGYDLSGSSVYWIQTPNNLVLKSALDGTYKSQITNDFPGSSDIPVNKIIVYDKTRVGLINANKDLFIYNEGEKETYFRKIGSDVESLAFSDDGKKMLFWSGNEIFVYFVRNWDVQPVRAENDLTSITRYSEKIENVQWSKDYEHVIFNTGQWVKAIELDGRDHRNCMDLISTENSGSFIRYNNSLEYLFFTDKSGDRNILKSIIFPEPTPILGIGG